LAKELPKLGWECDVLTVKPVAYRFYEPELLNDLVQTRIYRAGSLDPQRLLYLTGVREVKSRAIERGRSLSNLFFPDPKVGWVRLATRLGRTLLENRRHDLLLSSSPPVSSHLIGRTLAREFKTPWVADFRDYWTAEKPERVLKSKQRIKNAYALIESIKSEASALTAVNESTASFIGGARVIRNSFDSGLLSGFENRPERDKFIIGLFGTFNDFFSVEPLLQLLTKLREINEKIFDKVKLLQVGDTDERWLNGWLNKYEMTDIVEYSGFHPRAEAIRIAARSALFYLSLPAERDRALSPGRTYYLLASGRPILAAVPKQSDIGRILERAGNNICFEPHQADETASRLEKLIENHQSGEITACETPDYAGQFSSTVMAQSFATLFDELTG
jgi:glycosyltransferase involved in cell wall biosynthesis